MELQSRLAYATILACIVVGVIAPNTAIDYQDASKRGARKDDPNRSQQLRKLLQRYNSKVPAEQIRYKGQQTDTMRRRLAQFIDSESPETENNSPVASPNAGSQSSTPGPAPGPRPETTPAPDSYNPFVPPSEDNRVCCCRGSDGNGRNRYWYEEDYKEPPPSNLCCCGERSKCCPQGGLIKIICGGGQVCGILMLLSALIAVLVLSICMAGTFFARRRRNQLLAMHAAGGSPSGAITSSTRPADQITISEAEIPGLRVKYGSGCLQSTPSSEEEGGEEVGTTIEHDNSIISTSAAPGTVTASETKECPICLDTVAIYGDAWAVFPCTHGCCRTCFTDLLRHSSRRVNNNSAVWSVMCPLCRKMAVAPEGEMPPLSSRRHRRATMSEGDDAPSSPSAAAAAEEEAETQVENSGDQAQQPSTTASPPQP